MAQTTLSMVSKADLARIQGAVRMGRHLWSSRRPGSADSMVTIDMQWWLGPILCWRPFRLSSPSCGQGWSGWSQASEERTEGAAPSVLSSARAPSTRPRSRQQGENASLGQLFGHGCWGKGNGRRCRGISIFIECSRYGTPPYSEFAHTPV